MGQRQRRDQELTDILKLLSQHSLAKWPLLLGASSDEDVSVMENLYSILMFDQLHKFQLKVPRVLKSCPIQYLPCDDVYSQPLDSAEKRKKESSLKVSLLKARSGILPHM